MFKMNKIKCIFGAMFIFVICGACHADVYYQLPPYTPPPNPYGEALGNALGQLLTGAMENSRREAAMRRQQKEETKLRDALAKFAQNAGVVVASEISKIGLWEYFAWAKNNAVQNNIDLSTSVLDDCVIMTYNFGKKWPTLEITIYLRPQEVHAKSIWEDPWTTETYRTSYSLPEHVQIRNVIQNALGVELFSDNVGRIIVKHVYDAGVAQKNGIKVQDEIVKLDSNVLKGVPLSRIARFLSDKYEKKAKVQLTYKRNGKIKSFSFYIILN